MTKCEQIDRTGRIVLDYDQILKRNEIKKLLFDMFNPIIRQDRKQFILYGKIALLVCNVTYLGNPHPLSKKRIQLKKYYLDYLNENELKGLKTLYLGIYSFKKTRLFVIFEPSTYATKKSHNSSAHIHTINLQYAQLAGKFEKIDAFSNKIMVFNSYEFIRFIKALGGEFVYNNEENFFELISNYLSVFKDKIKKEWLGIDCYKEMMLAKDNNFRQSEWQGRYFEFLFKKFLLEHPTSEIFWHSEKKNNGIDLDLKFDRNRVYGDLKADQIEHDILGNSFECLDKVLVENHGTVYYICCLYRSEKDSDHNYQVTRYRNNFIRDPKRKYDNDKELKNNYGKKMKYSVFPKILCVLKIDETMYSILKKKPFQQGRNSNGKERKAKLKIDKNIIDALTVYVQKI